MDIWLRYPMPKPKTVPQRPIILFWGYGYLASLPNAQTQNCAAMRYDLILGGMGIWLRYPTPKPKTANLMRLR